MEVTMFGSFLSDYGPFKLLFLEGTLQQLEDVQEMFKMVWNIEEVHRHFTPPSIPMKSESTSERTRVEGNISFKEGDLEGAKSLYDLSIITAPHPELQMPSQSKESLDCSENIYEPVYTEGELTLYKSLALGYANRSAVYLSLNKYDNCLSDIDMAFRYGYPPLMKSKLEERRERCLKAKQCSRQTSAKSGSNLVSNNTKAPPVLKEPSHSVPSFSSALKVAYSPDKGIHVIATRDILPGEVIAVEKNYCSHISSEENHCPACLVVCDHIVPCPRCSLVCFCSESCRTKGLANHLQECEANFLLEELITEEDIFTKLAMKVVVHATFPVIKEKFLALLKKRDGNIITDLRLNADGICSSTDYTTVYHTWSRRRSDKILKACIKALLLTKVLQQTGNFFTATDGKAVKPTLEDLLLTGTALLWHIVHIYSIFVISDIKTEACCVTTQKTNIGAGIYPTLSMMKHSCNPPTVFYNFGHVKIVRLVMPIKKDQEVTLAFADRYQMVPLAFRKIQLEIQGIKCSCEACTGLWPSMPDIPQSVVFNCIACTNEVAVISGRPMCTSCGIVYSRGESHGNKKERGLVRKWWAVVDQINKDLEHLGHLHTQIQAGKPVTKSDYKFVCNVASLINTHVRQPSMVFLMIREIFIVLFYREM